MDLTVFQTQLKNILSGMKIKFNEPMAQYTSFRIGGPAEAIVFPQNNDELREILKASVLLDRKFLILGAGTNILAPDHGIPDILICLKDYLPDLKRMDGNHIWVSSGITMTRAAVFAAGLGLSGLEFAHGIPGSVGGGIYMNAGAYGGEIKNVCESADIMWADGNVETLTKERLAFSYRHSVLQEQNGIVLGGAFELAPADPDQIKETMRDLMKRRRTSQPLDMPSAGSSFKRPQKGYAAALIESCGLKGYAVGDAAISEKHAGFAVNMGHATSEDMVSLLDNVSNKVFQETGVRLEPEIRIW